MGRTRAWHSHSRHEFIESMKAMAFNAIALCSACGWTVLTSMRHSQRHSSGSFGCNPPPSSGWSQHRHWRQVSACRAAAKTTGTLPDGQRGWPAVHTTDRRVNTCSSRRSLHTCVMRTRTSRRQLRAAKVCSPPRPAVMLDCAAARRPGNACVYALLIPEHAASFSACQQSANS